MSHHAAGQTFLIEGQITRGGLRSGLAVVDGFIDIRRVVYENYPIDYSATLVLDGQSSSWDFRFEYDSVASETDDLKYNVNSSPRNPQASPIEYTPHMLNRVNQNQVLVSEASISIAFDDLSVYTESFDLEMDLDTGLGSWGWLKSCPVCSTTGLPSAYATITSVQLIPEPSSLALLSLAGGALLNRTRKIAA